MARTRDGGDEAPPHIGPSWIAVNHYNWTGTGALVHIVDCEPV